MSGDGDVSVWVKEAYKEAQLGLSEGGLPIGSVLVSEGGEVLARGHNLIIILLSLLLGGGQGA